METHQTTEHSHCHSASIPAAAATGAFFIWFPTSGKELNAKRHSEVCILIYSTFQNALSFFFPSCVFVMILFWKEALVCLSLLIPRSGGMRTLYFQPFL